MYEKKILFFIFMSILFISCKSTRILPDDGTGADKYRELQNKVRDGETELVITGERISNDSEKLGETSAEIRRSSNELGEQLNGLESSIKESTRNNEEIGRILQQIRTRKITEDKLIKLGIEFNKTEESENKN